MSIDTKVVRKCGERVAVYFGMIRKWPEVMRY